MKATLEFDLDEDSVAFDMAVKAGNYHATLWDLYNEFRTMWKHGESDTIKVDDVWETFHRVLADNDVSLT